MGLTFSNGIRRLYPGATEIKMKIFSWIRFSLIAALLVPAMLYGGLAFAAEHLGGRVLGGGAPIAKSTVTLWAATANAPKKLAETKTNQQGQFEIRAAVALGNDTSLYLVATGGEPKAHNGSGENPAIVLLAVLGNKPPETVTINEFTTVASVWTNLQFLSGPALQGYALGLHIAGGQCVQLC
jgi:hypothetical protein